MRKKIEEYLFGESRGSPPTLPIDHLNGKELQYYILCHLIIMTSNASDFRFFNVPSYTFSQCLVVSDVESS